MSIPKKFNETVNFKNRFNSLNELIFFTIKYDYKFTDDYRDHLHEEFDVEKEISGVKEFYALNEEQATAKINNWFTVLEKRGLLSFYDIKSIESKSFYETLKDKKLLDIIQ